MTDFNKGIHHNAPGKATRREALRLNFTDGRCATGPDRTTKMDAKMHFGKNMKVVSQVNHLLVRPVVCMHISPSSVYRNISYE